jgi:2-polyprenyl-3-methyl-5-hydroxy-6-metoxy-1,4-benzoquinol methylase
VKFETKLTFKNREEKAHYVAQKYKSILQGKVLDVGPGECYIRNELPPEVQYVGVGLSEYVDVKQDLEHGIGRFVENAFDTVLCLDVLEHIDNLHPLFAELVRVSSKYIIISLPNNYKTVIDNFLFTHTTAVPKYYKITPEFKKNRHRWFFGYIEALNFVKYQVKKYNLEILQLDSENSPPQQYSHCPVVDDMRNLTHGTLLETRLYKWLGKESCRYGNGVHTKHKHIKYHDFFIQNIYPREKVLDIGCGNGAVDVDIAKQVKDVKIVGIDIDPDNITYAEEHHTHPKIIYLRGNALTWKWKIGEFDIIVISNMLEHIENRVELLRKVASIRPERILLRVPALNRSWQVPLKKELGIDYMLDDTHYIEYTQEELEQEIKSAGLNIVSQQSNWGEFWVILETSR